MEKVGTPFEFIRNEIHIHSPRVLKDARCSSNLHRQQDYLHHHHTCGIQYMGMDLAEALLADLTPVWILLDYFGFYFKHYEYGHLLLRQN